MKISQHALEWSRVLGPTVTSRMSSLPLLTLPTILCCMTNEQVQLSVKDHWCLYQFSVAHQTDADWWGGKWAIAANTDMIGIVSIPNLCVI